MQSLILLIIGSLFFAGCANLDVAQKAYLKGDYNRSIAIYEAWAKRGFPQAKLRLAQLANSGLIKSSPDYIIQNALYAYQKGYKKAANLLFYTYYKIGEYKKAKSWFDKVQFDSMDLRTYTAYLQFLQNHINDSVLQTKLLQALESYALNSKNPKALYALGKFFEDSIFLNLQKSEHYYKMAYETGFLPAGTKLGLLYIYKLHNPSKGLKLLKTIANKDNGTSAYNIALYLYKKMQNRLQRFNNPCISFTFRTPKEFFKKKIKAALFQKLFLEKNVAPWLLYAYKRGYLAGKIKLISLDLASKNFDKKSNLSKMDLFEAIHFLEQVDLFRAKMVLAKIYESYPNLHQLSRAKAIYEEYIQINKIDAYWHLYQFYKRFYPQNSLKKYYLDYLVQQNFTPAQIEKAYFDILDRKNIEMNMKILHFFAEQKNILALTYLASIYAHNNELLKYRRTLKRLCRLTSPLNESLDMKIAQLYSNQQILSKAATIYQYYASHNPTAAFRLAKIYNKLQECKKYLHWLKIAKENGLKQAELEYAKLVIKGEIDGNFPKALAIIRHYASVGDPVTLTLLGDLYKNGIAVRFDPQKAITYYMRAIKSGYTKAYLNLISLYKLLNLNGTYNQKILYLYRKFINQTGNKKLRLEVAQFLVSQKMYKQALQYIKRYRLYRYDLGKYLYYNLTGKRVEFGRLSATNNPKLLLLRAKLIQNRDRKKALYLAFLAAFNNVNGSSEFIVRQLKFFSPTQVRKIYRKAKEEFLKNAATSSTDQLWGESPKN